MGVFYNSVCALGSGCAEVERLLDRWMAARGFERSSRPDLFDLDGTHERSAFLVSNSEWVLVFFSHYDEEWRLIHELGALATPLLYVWVYDSEVWGYDLLVERRFAGTFNSEPSVHQTFADRPQDGDQRPVARAEVVAQALGKTGLREALRRLEKRRRPYPEDICREFCRLIEAEPAASSFDEFECGVAQLLDGWQTRQLLFVRQDLDSEQEVDLHQHPLTCWQPPERDRLQEESVPEIPPELLRELQQAHRRRRLVMMALRPVSWIARSWRAVRQAGAQLADRWVRGESEEFSELILGSGFQRRGDYLVNPRHQCRLQLPPDAESLPSSSRPSAVFAFRLGETRVTCSARRLPTINEVLRAPDRSEVLADEIYRVAGCSARQLLFRLPTRQALAGQRQLLGIHIVQTEVAFYVFLYRRLELADPAIDALVRSVVETFEVADQPPRLAGESPALEGGGSALAEGVQ